MGRRPKKTRTPAEMKVTLEALVTSYLADMRLRGLTHNTVTTSERILNRLAHRLGPSTPIGSPTAISPRLVTLMDLWAQRQSIIKQTRRRNGHKTQAEGQLAMF